MIVVRRCWASAGWTRSIRASTSRMRAPHRLSCLLRVVAETAAPSAQPGGGAEFAYERVPFGARAFRSNRVVEGVRFGDFDVELRQPRGVLRIWPCSSRTGSAPVGGAGMPSRVNTCTSRPGAPSRVAMSCRPLASGRCASWPSKASSQVPSSLRKTLAGRRLGAGPRSRWLRSAQAGVPSRSCIAIAAVKCWTAGSRPAERGGEQAEEMVDGAVVRRAAADHDVGAGVRFELGVDPCPVAAVSRRRRRRSPRPPEVPDRICRRCPGSRSRASTRRRARGRCRRSRSRRAAAGTRATADRSAATRRRSAVQPRRAPPASREAC